MSTYLYDTPWWLLAVLVGAGALFGWSGLSRRDKPLGGLGLVLLLAGVGLFVSSKLVETDQEQVVRRTTELIASVEKRDWSTMESLMAPDATASVNFFITRRYKSRDEIMTDAKAYVGKAGSFSLNVQRVEPKEDPSGQFTADTTVYVAGDQFAQLSVWRFKWRKDGDAWVCRNVELVQWGVQPNGQK